MDAPDLSHLTEEEMAALKEKLERLNRGEQLVDLVRRYQPKATLARIDYYFERRPDYTWDSEDRCREGHVDYDLQKRSPQCSRCCRPLHPEGCVGFYIHEMPPNAPEKIGFVGKNCIQVRGQIHRPAAGKDYIPVRVYQRNPSAPVGSFENDYLLESFDVFLEEP